ncbi:hypothetical protein [Acidovorax sp.]|uniref:hypothetical protein n=1 Tax=Acidovorax sp. TaxID=1872122 RepID=UPI002ACD660D|nr:hypothetical protein [Acidovorax sp.]MDZ7865377.1 hypothetical protein [Acidovorax sp.]
MAAFPLSARNGMATSSTPTTPSSALSLPPKAAPVAGRDNDMSLVNLAARQRMLSQRMVPQTVLAARGSDLHMKAARSSLALFTDSQARLVVTARHLDAPAETSSARPTTALRAWVPPSTHLPSRWAQRWTWLNARARGWTTPWRGWWNLRTARWTR